jgi:hypothetical protein
MARMTKEDQEEEYDKSKPFSKAGRVRAAKVALGSIKGQPQSVRKKHQVSKTATQTTGTQKSEVGKAAKAKEKASERPPPSKPGKKP